MAFITQPEIDAAIGDGVGFPDPTARARAPVTTENLHRLRETRMRLRKLAAGEATQMVINVGPGDSYVDGDYWTPVFAKSLQDRFGFAGVGFVGFSFFGTATAPPFVTGGAQPNFGGVSTVCGNVRPDLVAKPTFDGTWTSVNSPGTGMPNISFARSSTAGDRVRFGFPVGHNAARLFYVSNTAGSFRYSWDGGTTWVETVTLAAGQGGLSRLLTGTPATAATLIFEVVSGTVELAGVDMQSSASGVRVHKLGLSGSATNTWSVGGNPYTLRMADLGANLVIVGLQTNDQGAAFVPETTYLAQFSAIITAIRRASFPTGLPNADLLLTSPPENLRTNNVYPMARYSAVTRDFARANDAAYLDHQLNFGELPAQYSSTSGRPWYHSDLVHPATQTGGRMLADATLRAIGA